MILSLDIGGTKIASGLVKNEKIFSYQKILWSKPLTRRKIIGQIISLIGNWKLEIGNFKAIALGIAGQVKKNGEVFVTRHLFSKRTKIALKKIIEQKFHLPVFVENDANCFILGEAIFGQGKKEKFVVGLTIGTGIGGGVVIDKKIIKGKDGFACEFGHQIIQVGGRQCSCGKRGCFEAYASGQAMEKFYFELTKKKKNTFQIRKEFIQKKPEAIFVVNETAKWLAIGLANLVNILNPDVIIIGGGLVGFKSFVKIALKNIKPWLLIPETKTKILVSRLKERAALLGASQLFR